MYCCPIQCFYVYFFVCVNVLLLVPNHNIHSDKVKACVEIKLCKKQDIRYPQIKSKASWISLNSFLFPKTYNPPHSYLIEVWSIPCFNCYWSRTIWRGPTLWLYTLIPAIVEWYLLSGVVFVSSPANYIRG